MDPAPYRTSLAGNCGAYGHPCKLDLHHCLANCVAIVVPIWVQLVDVSVLGKLLHRSNSLISTVAEMGMARAQLIVFSGGSIVSLNSSAVAVALFVRRHRPSRPTRLLRSTA